MNPIDKQHLDKLYATNDITALFAPDGSPSVVCPFPGAGRLKHALSPAQSITEDMIDESVLLSEVDPRELHGSQPRVLSQHVRYYLTDTWALTGVTSADRHKDANRFPLVWRNQQDQLVIVAGHHRAAAALLQGRPLLCRVFPVSPELRTQAVALLPRVLWGDHSDIDHVVAHTAADAVVQARSGHVVLCPDRTVAITTCLWLEPAIARRHLPILPGDEDSPPVVRSWENEGDAKIANSSTSPGCTSCAPPVAASSPTPAAFGITGPIAARVNRGPRARP